MKCYREGSRWGRRRVFVDFGINQLQDQIYEVFKFLPDKVQVALFSATMPADVLEVRMPIVSFFLKI